MWYIHTMENHPAIKKNEIMPFAATWMDGEVAILNEVTQTKTNTIWYHLYVESKNMYKLTYLLNRNQLTYIENKLTVTKREMRKGKDKAG